MIVTLAAWLYLIQALLTLGSLFSGPFGLGGGTGKLATVAMAALFGAMGYGLLKREAWGRWLALGSSLLSWTLGSLALLGLLGAAALTGQLGAFFKLLSSGGAYAFLALIIVFVVLVMVISVVIGFKLFFHLCAPEGCEEFGVDHGSAKTVAASVSAWLALFVGQAVMSSGGLLPLMIDRSMARSDDRDAAREQDRQRAEAARQIERVEREGRLEAEREGERQRREHELLVQQQAAAAQSAADPAETVDAAPAPAPAPEPELYTNNGDRNDEKTTANQILKCRDASGGVMFTQGYCPPGTKRVEMPGAQ